MAAFYPWLVCLFYSVADPLRRDRFLMLRLLGIRSEVEKIIHWMSEILFAAEIALRCLHRCMPQQELNLLQLSSTVMTQLRAGPPQIVGGNMLQARSLAAGSDHVPDNVLR